MVLDKGPPDRVLSGSLPLGRGRSGTGLADLSDTDPVRVPGLERGEIQNGDPCHGPYQAGGYQTGPYQEGPYQEPYKVPTHYQTKKKQYQPESYQEPYVEEEHTVPKPFAYQYGGIDSQGLESSKVENQGEDGVVRGEYRVQLPDGRTQIVSYTADEEHGYQAEVRYEGEARPEVPEPNDYLGPEGQVRVRQYPKHTRQPYGRY